MPYSSDATPEDPALLIACAKICAVCPDGGFDVAKNICDAMKVDGFALTDKDAMKWAKEAKNMAWIMDPKNSPEGHPALAKQHFESIKDEVGEKRRKLDQEAARARQQAINGAATEAALRQVTAAAHDVVGGDSVRKLGNCVSNSTQGVPLSQQSRENYAPVKKVGEHERPTFELVTNMATHTARKHLNFNTTNFPTVAQQKQGKTTVGKETNPLQMMDRIRMLGRGLHFAGAITSSFARDLSDRVAGVGRVLQNTRGDGKDSDITDEVIADEMEKHFVQVVNHMLSEGAIDDEVVPEEIWNEYGPEQMMMRRLFRKRDSEGKSQKCCEGCQRMEQEVNLLTRRVADLERRGAGKAGGKGATPTKERARILKGTKAQCAYYATSKNGCAKGDTCPLAKNGHRGAQGWKTDPNGVAPDESDLQ